MKAAAKASIVVVIVFIVGFVSGIGAIACFQIVRTEGFWQKTPFLTRPFTRYSPRPAERLEQLARELDLTPEQRKQYEPILRAGMDKIRILRRKHRPEVREVLSEIRLELRSILNEKQCRRFDELMPAIGPGRTFSAPGRCLQNYPKRGRRQGSGRDHRAGYRDKATHRQ